MFRVFEFGLVIQAKNFIAKYQSDLLLVKEKNVFIIQIKICCGNKKEEGNKTIKNLKEQILHKLKKKIKCDNIKEQRKYFFTKGSKRSKKTTFIIRLVF